MRKIHIIFEPNQSWNKYVSGVYKITFGEKFYIGRTNIVFNRWWNHNKSINDLINRNLLNPRESHYGGLQRYLFENPNIKIGYMQVIYRTECFYDMCNAEDLILKFYKNHPDALNRNFYASSPSASVSFMMQMTVRNNKRYFLNPSNNELFQEGDVVTSQCKKKTSDRETDKDAKLLYLDCMQDYVDKYGKGAMYSRF